MLIGVTSGESSVGYETPRRIIHDKTWVSASLVADHEGWKLTDFPPELCVECPRLPDSGMLTYGGMPAHHYLPLTTKVNN